MFRELHADFRRLRQACDLWTAASFAKLEKRGPGAPERIPTTDHVLRALRNQPGTQGVMKTALELADEQRFFHWPLEFAEIFAAGGFHVALGNPPWEKIKLKEQEFFASRDREIAQAPSKAVGERLLQDLPKRNRWLRPNGIGPSILTMQSSSSCVLPAFSAHRRRRRQHLCPVRRIVFPA